MMGMVRTSLAIALGVVVFVWLPRNGLLSATQELIGFLSLLMAGLLPAMTLTATILRGEGISARRVDEYAGALHLQLRFWAVLFGAAAVGTLGIVGAKIFSSPDTHFRIAVWRYFSTEKDVVSVSLGLAGAGVGIVLQRLYRAYSGLRSLLDLNIALARSEAISRDKTIRDALARDVQDVRSPREYADDPNQ